MIPCADSFSLLSFSQPSLPGFRPARGELQGKLTRTVNVVAEVMAVDPVKQTITLRGPKRTVTLPVQNPDHFKVVKVGDHVEATYARALALSLEPAPAANK